MNRSTRFMFWLTSLLLGSVGVASVFCQELAVDSPAKNTSAILVRLPLPLTGTADESVRRAIEEVSMGTADNRAIVVLEFGPVETADRVTEPTGVDGSAKIGRGTSFERALSLARFLSGPIGSRVRSVAYLPQSIEGHAVLVALACEEILAAPGITLGNAACDEARLDKTVREAYLDIQSRRQIIPVAAVQAMLDVSQQLFQVNLIGGGERFVLQQEQKELEDQGKIWGQEDLSIRGQLATFTSEQMQRWRWTSRLVKSVDQLQDILRLTEPLQHSVQRNGAWAPVVVHLHGNINSRSVNQLLRGLEEAIKRDKANLAFIQIDSPGGNLQESLRLSQTLASLPNDEIQTVAYVVNALGDASIIAMSCDAVYLSMDAKLGGPGEATIEPEQLLQNTATFEDLARKTGRSMGQLMGPASPTIPVFRFDHADGRQRWATQELVQQWPDQKEWTRGEQLDASSGLDATWLQQNRWTRVTKPSLKDVASDYGIQDLPEIKQTNRIESMVQKLAEQNWLPPLLITVGFMMFMLEISTPGVGLPGFISALCFLMLFWIRFLNGTVEWLEILLFLFGIVFIAVEFLVLPGFGIFGIGGFVMLISGLVLASQTFVWPSNNYQLNEMAWNLSQVASAFGGLLIGLYLIRNQLENLPMFRWLALKPASIEEQMVISQREALVHWEHLVGQYGTTVTRCNPAGKARIGEVAYDVLSDGFMIQENQPVRVIEVRGSIIIVTSDPN